MVVLNVFPIPNAVVITLDSSHVPHFFKGAKIKIGDMVYSKFHPPLGMPAKEYGKDLVVYGVSDNVLGKNVSFVE